ncbi:MAG: hypothetical protein HYT12_04895 [Candidatus Liptonbacteria bacterium]|nr:hypothetical protein [Candidatus Liptonbacteria bacterium]
MSSYTNLKLGKPKNSEIEIEGEISVEVMDGWIKSVRAKLLENFEAPGFRKGHVPEEIFLKHMDEMQMLEKAAEDALGEAYPEIIRDNGIKTLGMPIISITKIAPKNPLGFKMRVGLAPEVSLPNYKKIAKNIMAEKSEEVIVSDHEVEGAVKQLRQMVHGTTPGADAKKEPEALTDETVKKFGDFKSADDFMAKLRESIKKEKEMEQKRQKREKLAEELVKNTKIILPEIVLNQEVNAARENLYEDAKRAGITPEDYLKQINKTEKELLAEQKGYIERQMKTRFILEKIAEEEKIKVPAEEVEREAALLKTRYKNTDIENLKDYAELVMKNEKVLRFLEEGEK